MAYSEVERKYPALHRNVLESGAATGLVSGACMALIAMIGDMIAQDAQFIIATHSPILLAFPNALIYSCDRVPIERVRFEELEHVVLTRDFLNAPEKFLRHLR